jgi:hypothetical protein
MSMLGSGVIGPESLEPGASLYAGRGRGRGFVEEAGVVGTLCDLDGLVTGFSAKREALDTSVTISVLATGIGIVNSEDVRTRNEIETHRNQHCQ